jgi:hypothetical protein
MTIRTYTPRVQVILTKNVGRSPADGASERYQGANQQIDLTPYLGDRGEVRVHKGIREPAGGFVITFGDRIRDDLADTLYGLVEPMDHVAIRMARDPAPEGELPLVMRGWVSEVARPETMGADGRPMRVVVVSGQDYGKILQIIHLSFRVWMATGHDVLGTFRLQEATGMEVALLPASSFMQQAVERIVNPQLDRLWLSSLHGGELGTMRMGTDASVLRGRITPDSIAMYEGDLWGLLASVADLPWNELFVEDRADGVYLVYRPLPYQDMAGQWIGDAQDPNVDDPEGMTVSAEDVKSLQLARTDHHVANFYWVELARGALYSHDLQRLEAMARGTVLDTGYPNDDPALYGVRELAVRSLQTHDANTGHPPDGQGRVYADNDLDWQRSRIELLKLLNRDNVLWEEGSIVVKGSPRLKPGRYLTLRRGGLTARYYVTAVDHQLAPFRGYTTTCRVERGTGFLTRVREQRSPYWLEGRPGVYE